MKHSILSLLTFIFSLFTLSVAHAQGVSDALKNFSRSASNAVSVAESEQAKQEAFNREATALEKKVNIKKLSAQEIEQLFQYGGLNLERYTRQWLEPMLAEKAAKQSDMAFLRWKYMPENDGFMHSDKETAALISFLNAKDLQAQLTDHPDYAQDVLAALATMKDANWHTDGFSAAVVKMLDCSLSETATLDCVKAFNSIARVDSISKDERETVRKACLNQYNTLLAKLEIPRKQKICREQIAFLEGPFACGTLVGGKAPQLDIIRAFKQVGDSITTPELKSLNDFKGKVIMLDFWGTKCVPCIQSFPEMAELQSHYEGKDVVIIGVTSLQGYFADMVNHRTIQCRNNPEKELGCFPDYMKSMGITWHIAVTEQDVMNTDYGVLAIPHVTIIDRDGVVRHNAVNASNEEKIRLIDELLENK